MLKKRNFRLGAGLCLLGTALPFLLCGCGGGSTESKSFGNYTNAGPAAYGLEGTAANGVLTAAIGGPFFFETSGFQSGDATSAYLTAATDFKVITGAGVLPGVDPSGNGKVPLGFSTSGQYIDANSAASTPPLSQSIKPGAAVVFRASISNGLSAASRSVIPIQYNGISLTSSDPEWTLGTLPLTFNFTNSGPFANATYVTGSPVQSGQGTPTAFNLPFTTTGLHTVTLTVTDTTGQQTQTNFTTVVTKPTDVAFFAQNVVGPDAANAGKTTTTAISPGDKGELDNAGGTPVTVAGAVQQATADAQGTIILFVPQGTYTFKVTSADGKTVTVQKDATGATAPVDLTTAGGTAVIQ